MSNPCSLRSAILTRPALAVMAAAGIILLHILACTESPMAFSPDGRHLAFVTAEPYDMDNAVRAGPVSYRLMVLSDGRDLRVVEQSADCMLSAPAYSPDGRRLCYLRIPLLSAQELSKQGEAAQQREKAWEAAASGAPDTFAPATAAEAVPVEPMKVEILSLPDLEQVQEAMKQSAVWPPLAASLVIRSTDDFSVLETIPVDMGGMKYDNEDFAFLYTTMRPQFGPDGQWIYTCIANRLVAVNPRERLQRILATPALSAVLSPDGSMLAYWQEEHTLAVLRTDGTGALYKRWPEQKLSPSGIAWLDTRTVCVSSTGPDAQGEDRTLLLLLRLDAFDQSRQIALPGRVSDDDRGELAIASDGQHMALATSKGVYFMDGQGKVIQSRSFSEGSGEEKSAILVQPTFSPDSKQLVFKQMISEPDARATHIAFFTPEGKEVSRVAIPAIEPAATRPIEQPSQQ